MQEKYLFITYPGLFAFYSISISLIFTFTSCIIINTRNNHSKKRNDSIFSLPPELGLTELPLFWGGLTFPILLFLFFSFPAFTTYGFLYLADNSQLINALTLPTILLSITIPFTAAISRAHATHQTAEQILHIKEKNNIEIYFRYKEDFTKSIKEMSKVVELNDFTIHVKTPFNIIHFGKPTEGTPNFNANEINKKYIQISQCHDLLKELVEISNFESKDINWAISYLKKATTLTSSLTTLTEKYISFTYTTFKNDDLSIKCNKISLDSYYLVIDSMHIVMTEVLNIYHDYNFNIGTSDLNLILTIGEEHRSLCAPINDTINHAINIINTTHQTTLPP